MQTNSVPALLDKALMSNTLENRNAVYQAIYDEYFIMIYAIARRRLPGQEDDIVQGFFCDKVLKFKMETLQKHVAHLESYLYRCLTNYCNSKGGKKKRDQLRMTAYVDLQLSNHTYRPIHQTSLSMDLEMAIADLPEKQREAFVLRFKEGLKYKDVAASMQTVGTEGAVKQLIRRARTSVQKYLLA